MGPIAPVKERSGSASATVWLTQYLTTSILRMPTWFTRMLTLYLSLAFCVSEAVFSIKTAERSHGSCSGRPEPRSVGARGLLARARAGKLLARTSCSVTAMRYQRALFAEHRGEHL
jgi:hypothetical protein